MYTFLVFVVVWWLVLFAVLPVGVRPIESPSQEEYHAAPKNPNLKRKALWTTAISAGITAVIMLLWNP